MRLTGLTLLLLLALAAPACDDEVADGDGDGDADGDGDGDGDADGDGDGDADSDGDGDVDADADADSDVETLDLVCEAHNGISSDLELAGASPDFIEYRAYMGSEMPYQVLRVQIFGDNVAAVEPGVYDLAGTTYEDCEVCVSILTGCSVGPCDRMFYPESGTVEITAIGDEGDRLAGRLRGVSMVEYDIVDGDIDPDPVPDGEDWCIADYSFDMAASSTHDALCGRPTVPCLNETVADFELESCATGEMVSMSELAEGNRALVYSMVTGWCPYCADWMETLVGYQATYADDGLEVAYVYGEDANQESPDATECLAYAARYGADPESFFLDHDGEYSFATTTWAMWPWIEESDALSLPWSTIIDAQTFEYVYTSHADPPLDFETIMLERLGL